VDTIDLVKIDAVIKIVPSVDELDILLRAKRLKFIIGAERLVVETLLSIDTLENS